MPRIVLVRHGRTVRNAQTPIPGYAFAEWHHRAADAAALDPASRPPPVLLAGHGWMNGFIARALRRDGWHGPRRRTRRHWAFAVYERKEAGAAGSHQTVQGESVRF